MLRALALVAAFVAGAVTAIVAVTIYVVGAGGRGV